ncbi:hypothetical protein [Naasia lichenicola]|uniref:Uncharacterized protein n=1 Tax=Naasia lichenicola TaxID=2565933 RepID=A0A4S4FRW5_9MICO|nr:hypothetical protein [Naasia lichenicola]THG33419.1 hypothetical protein E6C64_03505 [Naasia lichenicola]
MSKKIDRAASELKKALTAHAKVAGKKKVSKGRIDKASARVRSAANSYAGLVYSKTGVDSPFLDIRDPRLDTPVAISLKAERDALARRRAS